MHNLLRSKTVLMIPLFFATVARAETAIDMIKANELSMAKAAVANDGKVFDDLLADDFKAINSDGSQEDKSQYANEYRTGDFKITIYDHTNITTQTHGDVIIYQAQIKQNATYKGVDSSGEYRLTDIWLKQPNGSYNCISAQWTKIEK